MTDTFTLSNLTTGAQVLALQGPEGWGIAVRAAGRSSATQPRPVRAEVWDGSTREQRATGYSDVEQQEHGFIGRARLALNEATQLAVEDRWTVQDATLRLTRSVRVIGNAPGGFLTAITLESDAALCWPDVDAFAPGMIYGWSEYIPRHAIGAVPHYLAGARAIRIREDRLPAPLFGMALRDGTSITVLNPTPRGDTTRADGQDLEGTPLVDERFAFAALGGEERDGRLELGLWFPGSEGDVTYLANTPFADGQFGNNARRRWRERYHPLEDGFTQRYEVAFRFGAGERDQDMRRETWRWAWSELKPQVETQDLQAARHTLAAALEHSVQQCDDRVAPAHVVNPLTGEADDPFSPPVMMGFTGRAIETGELLLRETEHLSGEQAERRRERALAILETFARLPVAPPQAEGFDLRDGRFSSGVRSDFYLRALCEGGKLMLRAYQREYARGIAHANWRAWCIRLADWLLTQELPNGGFPRSWRDLTAEVVNADPRSSYAAVPFLVALARATGEEKYLSAACRAAEVCWALGGSRGYFTGGTLDNANVVDKEAGTLTLEAHLALWDATGDQRWIGRAQAAADFAETWIYLWNVPMPPDEQDADLHWKHGVTTVGAQLIASGHSLTDVYMAWDVANYACLAQITSDTHYLDVARILLHNTKAMLALPGRTFDLVGPGWQQEHWSFAPPRGRGIHRHWLPWVACSHLEGIIALEEFDQQLYAELSEAD